MMVSPDYRRCGIARSLIKTALNHARNHGVTSVITSTSMLQPNAIAMYEKFGWVRQKKVRIMILLDTLWIFFFSLNPATVKI